MTNIPPAIEKSMNRSTKLIGWSLGIAVIVALVLVPLASRWLLGDDNYWLQIFIWVLFYAYLGAAWNLIGGFARQTSFGHAGFVGIGAYTSSLLFINTGLSPWLGMLVGGVVAAAIGGVISFPCFRLRGTFFSLVTIAFAEMLRVWIELSDSIFGVKVNGVRGLLLPALGHRPWQFQFVDKRWYYYTILAFLMVILIVGWYVKRSRLGYYLAAIGDDEEAVASLGTNPARVKLLAMILSAFFTAIGGTFYAQCILFITPTRTMGLDFSIQMIIVNFLGGIGTVLGPVYGAFILVPFGEFTRAIWGGSLQGVHLIIYGVLLIAAILYWPQGISGWLEPRLARLIEKIARYVSPLPTGTETAATVNAPITVLHEGSLLPRHPASDNGEPLLVLRNVSRQFGGAIGVRNLSLEVQPGEIVGLIGPNGAGKTTVFNLITGSLVPDAGEIRLAGISLTGRKPDAINRLGVARTFQIVRPFPKLTTLENVVVALLPRVGSVGEARREAEQYLAFVGLTHRAQVLADGLGTGERKRLELARALATRPRLLLLDEVTAGVDPQSLPGLMALIEKVRKEGVTLVLIEHNLGVVTRVADRLVMLHLGEKFREGVPEAVVHDPQVVDIYIGAANAKVEAASAKVGGESAKH